MRPSHRQRRAKRKPDTPGNVPTGRPSGKAPIELLFGLILVVGVLTTVAHWPALSARALSFDDDQYLTDNALVQNPSWASAWRFLSEVSRPSTVEGYYQPLTMLSLMLDEAVGGRPDNLRPFHRTSLALHVVNAALVITLIYLLFGRVWGAAAVGLLFAVHPMTVEPIPWVGERKTLLAAFFSLCCLILYVRYAQKNDWKLYVGCGVAYVLALMSKPTSTPLPALMLLLDFWPLGRLRWRGVWEKLPLFVIGGVSAVITYVSQSGTAGAALGGGYSLDRVWLIPCHNIIFYLSKIVWPANLSSHYAFPEPLGFSDSMVLAGVIGTCILIPVLVISLRWTRAAMMGGLFFFIALLPTMQVLRFSDVIASDKFAYLPSVGLLMILAAFLGRLGVRSKTSVAQASRLCQHRRDGGATKVLGHTLSNTGGGQEATAQRVAVVTVILLLAGAEMIATRRYLVHWRDSVTLFRHMLTVTPNAAGVHNNLAGALELEGKSDDAIGHYRRAVEIKPDHVLARTNLGAVLQSQGRIDEAITCYRHALRIEPDRAETHNNLGTALQSLGRLDEAIGQYQQALKADADYAKAHYNLGTVFESQRRFDEAIRQYRLALKVHPDYAKAHCNLGTALSSQGMLDEGIRHFRQALVIDPEYARAHGNLAAALQLQGKYDEAIHAAEHAAGLTHHRDAKVLDTLAAAYAAAGRFDRAVSAAEEALALATAGQRGKLADAIRRRLELYRQAQPYRPPARSQSATPP